MQDDDKTSVFEIILSITVSIIASVITVLLATG